MSSCYVMFRVNDEYTSKVLYGYLSKGSPAFPKLVGNGSWCRNGRSIVIVPAHTGSAIKNRINCPVRLHSMDSHAGPTQVIIRCFFEFGKYFSKTAFLCEVNHPSLSILNRSRRHFNRNHYTLCGHSCNSYSKLATCPISAQAQKISRLQYVWLYSLPLLEL
jgi:hypothetical protein